MKNIRFEKGKPQSKKIKGKTFHALPIHTPQDGGWDESPELIKECLNKLPVGSGEVIACVLMGGGNAGEKYKASVRNLEGMIMSYKTIVLYVYNDWMYDLLTMTGAIAKPLPIGVPLDMVPKPVLYKDKETYYKLLEQYIAA